MNRKAQSPEPIYIHRLPEGRSFTLIDGDKFSDHLFYQENKTHQVFKVPSTRHNHPVEWRIELLRSLSKQYEQQAQDVQRLRKEGWEEQSASLMKIARHCEIQAQEMETTGKATHSA